LYQNNHYEIYDIGFQTKSAIYKNIAKNPEESPLRVVISTVALGMGADLRHVKTVIHAGPPQNLEGTMKYICFKFLISFR
jgi:superfamily II DNA helicase RecQ